MDCSHIPDFWSSLVKNRVYHLYMIFSGYLVRFGKSPCIPVHGFFGMSGQICKKNAYTYTCFFCDFWSTLEKGHVYLHMVFSGFLINFGKKTCIPPHGFQDFWSTLEKKRVYLYMFFSGCLAKFGKKTCIPIISDRFRKKNL